MVGDLEMPARQCIRILHFFLLASSIKLNASSKNSLNNWSELSAILIHLQYTDLTCLTPLFSSRGFAEVLVGLVSEILV